MESLESPNLRVLSVDFEFKPQDDWKIRLSIKGKYYARELNLRGINSIWGINCISFTQFPVLDPTTCLDLDMALLEILRIEGDIPDGFLDKLSTYYSSASPDSGSFQYDRRLHEVHLSNIGAYTAASLASLPIILNARKVIFHNLRPTKPGLSPPYFTIANFSSPWEYLWPLWRECARDTEIIGGDEQSSEALAAARSRIPLE
jgi:hypothetical protein